uniref:Uncharacterized protein n=1 Tax=Meloidogyne enterolobii TaxID=390850 RepID=A0A6V7WBB8_MELEN|nr:unnamed protein product [Meloidogyne enterolobii]
MIQDKYRQQSSDTASFVTYTITGVWIGNEEITDAMKRVVSLKNNLLKYSSIEELNDMRKNITDGIEKWRHWKI